MFRILSTLIVVTVFTTSMAQAGVFLTATPVVVNSGFGAPDAALTGFSSFAVQVASDEGELISAIDVSFDGPMHQRWSDVNFDGVTDQSPEGPLAGNNRGDTSLTPITGALTGSASTEDNLVDGPLADTFVAFVGGFDWGVGQSLTGAWGIPGASQSTGADVAYLVIPDGEAVAYDIKVSTSNGTFGLTGLIPVPEPTTLALTSLGMIGLLCTRRRRS